MANSAESSHVESATHGAAAASNVASPGLPATITIVGCDPNEGGGGQVADFSEFWQFGQDGGGSDGAHAGNGIEALSLGLERFIGTDDSSQDGVAIGDLFFQELTELARLTPAQGIGVMVLAIGLGHEGGEQLETAGGHSGQTGL